MVGAITRTSLPVDLVLSWSTENDVCVRFASTAPVSVTNSLMYGSGFAATELAATGTSGFCGAAAAGVCAGAVAGGFCAGVALPGLCAGAPATGFGPGAATGA